MMEDLLAKALILGFAAGALLAWLRFNCLLILEASWCPPQRRVQRVLARLDRTKGRTGVLSLLVLLRRQWRFEAVERCPACGTASLCATCERAVLLANLLCLGGAFLLLRRIRPAGARLVAGEIARIAGYMAHGEPGAIALQ